MTNVIPFRIVRNLDAPLPEPPKPKKPAKNKTRFPENWIPGAAECAQAIRVGMVDTETRNEEWMHFCAHHISNGSTMASWPHAWQTWTWNWKKWGRRSRPAAARAPSSYAKMFLQDDDT